jgi:hypothetical protein
MKDKDFYLQNWLCTPKALNYPKDFFLKNTMIRTCEKKTVIQARVPLNYNFQQSYANNLAISHQSELSGEEGGEVLRALLDPSTKTNKCLNVYRRPWIEPWEPGRSDRSQVTISTELSWLYAVQYVLSFNSWIHTESASAYWMLFYSPRSKVMQRYTLFCTDHGINPTSEYECQTFVFLIYYGCNRVWK